MDRNFNDKDDFEEFLKQKADQYKIYPADRVWNNIYRSLHHPGRWIGLGLLILLTGTSLFIGKNSIPVSFSGDMHPASHPAAVNHSPALLINRKAIPPATTSARTPVGKGAGMAVLMPRTNATNVSVTPVHQQADRQAVLPEPADEVFSSYALITLPLRPRLTASLVIPARKFAEHNDKPVEPALAVLHRPVTRPAPATFMLQFYSSSMISYRRLTSDNPALTGTPVSSQYAGNVNSYVHHKPAAGFELGGKLLYQLSDNLTVYGGAQLNYSRYYIDAFSYKAEKASIALNNNSFSADTLSGYTSIRNLSGFAPEQLQNQYWQLSVPLGLEIALLGHGRLQFNIGGGVQPTLLLNSNAYLISSDYKNYLQSPDLARRFNVHTNFEAFVSYKAGGMKWQLGPQFRSQLLSSYSNQYKVKEYLTEFGIKFAVSKSIR